MTIHSPHDDSLVTDKVQVASEKDIDDAVAAAKAAQPAWAALSGWQRASIMLKFADLLEKNADKLAKLEGQAMGQPITLARAFVKRPVDLWRYYAGYCGKMPGEVCKECSRPTLYPLANVHPRVIRRMLMARIRSCNISRMESAPASARGT